MTNLDRIFRVGDRVKIKHGRYEGKEGVIKASTHVAMSYQAVRLTTGQSVRVPQAFLEKI